MKGIITLSVFARWFLTELCLFILWLAKEWTGFKAQTTCGPVSCGDHYNKTPSANFLFFSTTFLLLHNFFMLVLLVEYIFLTTFHGLYFNHLTCKCHKPESGRTICLLLCYCSPTTIIIIRNVQLLWEQRDRVGSVPLRVILPNINYTLHLNNFFKILHVSRWPSVGSSQNLSFTQLCNSCKCIWMTPKTNIFLLLGTK